MATTLTGFVTRLFGRDSVAVNPSPVVILGAYDSGTGNPVPTPMAVSYGGQMPVVSPQVSRTAEFTKAAAAATYSANDVIANSTSAATLITFENCSRYAGGGGVIVAARMMVDQATLPTGFANSPMRLHIYQETITPINDNAPFTLLYANRVKRAGYIDFSGFTTGGSGSDASNALAPGVNLPFLTVGTTSLYGILETRTALSTNLATGAKFFFDLDIFQN